MKRYLRLAYGSFYLYFAACSFLNLALADEPNVGDLIKQADALANQEMTMTRADHTPLRNDFLRGAEICKDSANRYELARITLVNQSRAAKAHPGVDTALEQHDLSQKVLLMRDRAANDYAVYDYRLRKGLL